MASNNVNVSITAEDKTTAAFNSVKEKLNGLQKSVAGFKASLVGGLFQFTAIMESIRGLEDVGRAVYDDTVLWQGMQYTLEAAGLSAAESSAELKYLEETSISLGLNIKDVSSAFSRFILTGRATGESLPELNSQFKSVSEAMRIFHLGSQQATRSWLALTEIMAMGKVQSRQFTQQLGRDWPGIGPLIADALFPGQNSMERFYAAMKKGQISSEQFMEGFNKLMQSPAMQGALAGAIDSIQAAMGRFHTVLFNFFNEANNPQALNGLRDALNELSTTLNDPATKQGFDDLVAGMVKLVDWAVKGASAVAELGRAIGTDLGMAVTGTDTAAPGLASVAEEIKNVKSEMGALQSEMAQPANQTGFMQNLLQQKIDHLQLILKNLEAAQHAMMLHPGGTPYNQTDAAAQRPALGQLATIDASQFNAAAPKKSLPEQYTETMQKFQESYQKVLQMQDKISDVEKKNAALADKHQVPGMSQAMSLINEQIKASAQHTQEVATDIRAMVGTEVDGIVFTAQMAADAIKKLKDESNKDTSEMSQFGIQAFRNIEDATAQFFDSAGKKGETLRSILHGLFESLEKDAANLLAKELLDKAVTGMSSSSTSWVAALGQMFGGSHAEGGPIAGGKISLVGEQGPELFVPNTSGTIIPNHALGGMGGHSTSVNIDARGAGPDEVAKLLAMRNDILTTVQSSTEFRLQRGAWRTTRTAA